MALFYRIVNSHDSYQHDDSMSNSVQYYWIVVIIIINNCKYCHTASTLLGSRPVFNVNVSFIFKCGIKYGLDLRCNTWSFIVACRSVWHVQFHLKDILALKNIHYCISLK